MLYFVFISAGSCNDRHNLIYFVYEFIMFLEKIYLKDNYLRVHEYLL